MKNIRFIFVILTIFFGLKAKAQIQPDTLAVNDSVTDTIRSNIDSLPLHDNRIDSLFQHTDSSLIITDTIDINSSFGFKPEKENSSSKIDTSGVIYAWILQNDYLTADQFEIDTNLERFQLYNPLQRNLIYPTTLGNNCSASLSNIFFYRNYLENVLYLNSYKSFFNTYANTFYINTRKPFSHLYYYNGGESSDKEEQIELFHSQNVNRNLNIGFNLSILSDKGRYKYLAVKNKNFKAFSSYTGKKYTMHSTFNFNRYSAEESGGVNDSLFIATDQYKTKLFQTNFTGKDGLPYDAYVSNKVRYIDAMVSQKAKLFTIGQKADSTNSNSNIAEPTIAHVFQFRRTSKMYDELHSNVAAGPYYNYTYTNPYETADSIAHFLIHNKVQLDFKTKLKGKVTAGFFGVIGHEYEKFSYYSLLDSAVFDTNEAGGEKVYFDTTYRQSYYYMNKSDSMKYQIFPFNNGDTIADINDDFKQNNLYISGGIYGRFWTYFQSYFSAKLYFAGYKAGQTQIDGFIQTRLNLFSKPYTFKVKGSLENIKPSFQLNNYYSNNYIWEGADFNYINRLNLSSKIEAPSNKFELSGDYSLIRNFIYMTDSIPISYNNPLSVIAIGVEKEFVLWKLHLYNKLIYQVSENRQVVELPTLIYFNSTYLDHTWKFKLTGGEIRTMLGFDIKYATSYRAYGYNPAMAMFYQLNDDLIGNYPFVDFWLNVRLKRARFFAKFEHYNSTLWNRKDYYYAASYPAKPSTFKFGISWTFYD